MRGLARTLAGIGFANYNPRVALGGIALGPVIANVTQQVEPHRLYLHRMSRTMQTTIAMSAANWSQLIHPISVTRRARGAVVCSGSLRRRTVHP